MSAQYQIHGDVAVITLDHPPLNGLDLATRAGVVEALDTANLAPAIRALVLIGAGRAFSSGADIKEFGSPLAFQAPDLSDVVAAVERSGKPVVAALHGVAMGGGLELALGCHYRIAVAGCSVALPEVKLGLIPGAGGTQRLPRVLGVETALNMIISGEPVPAGRLAQLPDQRLFDRMAASDDTLLEEALGLAREAAARHADGTPLPLAGSLPCAHPQGDAYFQFVRNMIAGPGQQFPAALKCVDAVQAATTMTLADGLARERRLFVEIMHTPTSQALRHAFLAERAASRIEGMAPHLAPRKIAQVAVIGAGTMGTGISMNFLDAGLPVILLETGREALERGAAAVASHYNGLVAKGRLTADASAARLALLSTTLAYADIAQADLVIEAVFEDMSVKESVFRQLDAVMKPGAILASNTSTLDLDRIAAFTGRPQDVVGLHFFSPANVMKLLEVVRGAATSFDVLASAMAIGKKIRKTCVVSGVCDGFIGNRMIEQYLRQAGFLLDEGCSPQQVDRAIERFGFAMGPFRMSDLAGNDVGRLIRQRRYREQPDLKYSRTADLLCELGRFGQKCGAGWYDYLPGRRDPVPSDVVEEMIVAHRAACGTAPRAVPDDEIVQRLVYALVNEGAHILEQGIASRAGDIDLVYLTGYGFPRWRGGPMHYAEQVGLVNVCQAMQRLARNPQDDGAFWRPAPLLARLAAAGSGFAV